MCFRHAVVCVFLPVCACAGHKSKTTRPVTRSVLVVTLWTVQFNVGGRNSCVGMKIAVFSWHVGEYSGQLFTAVMYEKTKDAYVSSSILLFRRVFIRKATVSYIAFVSLCTRARRPIDRIL